MPDQQHSLSVEEVTASLQERYGLGDNLPTLADLPGLLRDESEQLGLGQSRRSMRASIVNVNLATSHEILGRLGDGRCVKMHQDYGTIAHPPTGDPLVSDLDQVQTINYHILDANRFTDDADTLRKLALRFEAKADAQESAHEPSGGSAAEHSTARRTQMHTDTATPDTDWRDVQRRIMEMYKRDDPYISISDLAKRLRCAKATIQKAMKPDQPALSGLTEDEKTIAIQNAELLRKWQTQRSKGKATLRATSLTKVVMNNTAQPREADPSDVLADDDVEKAMRHLIEEAKPEERAKLNDLDAAGRRAMAETYYAHKLDKEPSPLEDDPPDKRPQQVKEYKRV